MGFRHYKHLLTFLFLIAFVATTHAQYNFKAYYAKARINIDNRNYQEAINNLNICIIAQPNNSEVYFFRALCKYNLSDYLGAEKDFTSSLQSYHDYYYDAFRYRSMVRYQNGNYTGAIDDIKKLIDRQPNTSILYVERAFYYLANTNFNEAINDCKKAIKLKATGDNPYFCMAVAQDALTLYDEALQNYNIVLKMNPTNVDAWVRRGITKYKLEKYTEAIEDYNKALSLDSAYTFAFYNRAAVWMKLDKKEKAIQDYNMVIYFEPRNAYAWFNRSVLYANDQKYKEALSGFDMVLQLSPDNIQALYNRAKIRQNTGDYKGAINDYDRIISLYPYFMEAYYNRSQAKTMIKDYKGAKQDLETGKLMSSIYHSKSKSQLNADSVLLSRLSNLSGEFLGSTGRKEDTINIGFRAVFHLYSGDMSRPSRYTTVSLENYNSANAYPLFLTNVSGGFDTATTLSQLSSTTTAKEYLLFKAVYKSNLFLLNEARELLDQIILSDSTYALAFFARGVNTCREIEIMNNNPEPYFLNSGKTTVYENLRQEKCRSAVSDFSRMLKLYPDFSYASYNLAYVRCLLGDYNGALFDYEQAFKLNASFAEAYYNYGVLLYFLKYKLESCKNMSKAGELGLNEAFLFSKKFCGGVIEK